MTNIIINLDDVPSGEMMLEAISRLRKDAEILATIRSKKKDADPESLTKIANFLEMIVKRL